MVKVEEVCNTRPSPTKTVKARVDEVVRLKEIDHSVLDDRLKDFSWDGGQTDGSVVTRFLEETLFGDGADVCRPNVQGNLCCSLRSIEDLAEVQDHAIYRSLEDFW